MKTHKTILLLWLLVFAGSYDGLAQGDSITATLMNKEASQQPKSKEADSFFMGNNQTNSFTPFQKKTQQVSSEFHHNNGYYIENYIPKQVNYQSEYAVKDPINSFSLRIGLASSIILMGNNSLNNLKTQRVTTVLLGYSVQSIFFSINLFFPNRTKNVNEVQFNNETIQGEFFGVFGGGSVYIGGILNQNKKLNFIPSLSMNYYNFDFYCKKPKRTIYYESESYTTPIDKVRSYNFGFNLIIDYKLFHNRNLKPGIAIRGSYGYQPWTDSRIKTNLSEVLIGVIVYTGK